VGGAVSSPVGPTDSDDPSFRQRISMPNVRRTRGFTLIELLMVVVIIGILAAIAIPKFAQTKGKAYSASLKSELNNLSSVHEEYLY
jgi:prepilin-type N-terminal cleavage/methylation domain-containing protein